MVWNVAVDVDVFVSNEERFIAMVEKWFYWLFNMNVSII